MTLYILIKLRDRARRYKAHPKFIERLEQLISEESRRVNEILGNRPVNEVVTNLIKESRNNE